MLDLVALNEIQYHRPLSVISKYFETLSFVYLYYNKHFFQKEYYFFSKYGKQQKQSKFQQKLTKYIKINRYDTK